MSLRATLGDGIAEHSHIGTCKTPAMTTPRKPPQRTDAGYRYNSFSSPYTKAHYPHVAAPRMNHARVLR